MNEIIQHVLHDITIQQALLIILNLILIESLLSVDNAAVLATMVMDLPKEQRKRALKYGIVGAYIFRGICLVLAAWLIKIWWLKAVGGLYLLYLFIDYFYTKSTPKTEDDLLNKKESKFYKYTLGLLGSFWSTVALVELMDLAFSIDNVFAAVAFTDNIYLIWTGVFIGILAMRFVAQSFVRLMEKYPFLEKAAFIVIGILGVKLLLSIPAHYSHNMPIFKYIESEHFDMIVSIITVLVFFVPVITSLLFNYPKRHEIKEEEE
ncbi:MAG TPA: TerC family protein [Chitinophagales bacterium]|jgi:YkoY family integral membrane protein|nr:TerC family protein [Chitinophagales bacterium]MBP6154440.1 TerC family protein [Chitinophagales bacterium]HQV77661.1 TerC family protein [Chitinophagales bacterium]HQW78134.1 TerC family protein [Chitinophagales bacterium]HRB66971.1 TerC family protein [Chitinophagales bacterium]